MASGDFRAKTRFTAGAEPIGENRGFIFRDSFADYCQCLFYRIVLTLYSSFSA
jgi:hypothetical protein